MFTLVRFNLLIGCSLQRRPNSFDNFKLSHSSPSLSSTITLRNARTMFTLRNATFQKKLILVANWNFNFVDKRRKTSPNVVYGQQTPKNTTSFLFDVALYRYGRLQCSKKHSFYIPIITAHILRHYVFW